MGGVDLRADGGPARGGGGRDLQGNPERGDQDPGGRGWISRVPPAEDRRLVFLELTPAGIALMEDLYPEFNAAESFAVSQVSPRHLNDLTGSLRRIVSTLEQGKASA